MRARKEEERFKHWFKVFVKEASVSSFVSFFVNTACCQRSPWILVTLFSNISSMEIYSAMIMIPMVIVFAYAKIYTRWAYTLTCRGSMVHDLHDLYLSMYMSLYDLHELHHIDVLLRFHFLISHFFLVLVYLDQYH